MDFDRLPLSSIPFDILQNPQYFYILILDTQHWRSAVLLDLFFFKKKKESKNGPYLPQIEENFFLCSHSFIIFLLLPPEELQPLHNCSFSLELFPLHFSITSTASSCAFFRLLQWFNNFISHF